MTLLAILSRNGHIAQIEDLRTPGLASQSAAQYAASGVTCRIIPDEMKEDVLYLMGQVNEERKNGFVEERGAVPNGRPKKAGARGFGRMILPPFGGMLEGSAEHDNAELQEETPKSIPLPLSSKVSENKGKKILDDLIILRHG